MNAFKTHRITTHFVTIPAKDWGEDHDLELAIPHEPAGIMGYKDLLVHRAGDTLVVGYLVEDQWDQGYYFDEFDQGQFYNLGHTRYLPHIVPAIARDEQSRQEFVEELEAKHPGHVFLVDLYDHSGTVYSVHGEGMNDRLDTCSAAFVYVAPADCPDPLEYARSTMKDYTAFANNDVYGAVVCTFKRQEDGSWEEDEAAQDACWQILQADWAYAELGATFDQRVPAPE